MTKLTEDQIEYMTEPGRLTDGKGLAFEITKTGIKRWAYRYKIAGRTGKYIVGRYPALSLKEARKSHLEARELVRQGLNPAEIRRIKKREGMANIEGMDAVFIDSSFYSYLKWICGRGKICKREALERSIVSFAKAQGCKF